MEEIKRLIPHRPPFLFIDEIVSMDETSIVATRRMDPDEAFFKGHYPDFPIMPGVLICEAIFQAGALLLSKRLGEADPDKAPVVTRIGKAKFKRMAAPGDTLELRADLVEQVANAFYMKGKALVEGDVAVTIEFACALVDKKALRREK